jgi:hypothetical protein
MRKAIFIRVSLKGLVILLISLQQYVKLANFVLWCWGISMYILFCGGGFSVSFVLYSLFCSMVLMVFTSVSFALLFIGCVIDLVGS